MDMFDVFKLIEDIGCVWNAILKIGQKSQLQLGPCSFLIQSSVLSHVSVSHLLVGRLHIMLIEIPNLPVR